MPENPNELMKPAGAAVPGDEPVIHVIPEKFYGAALKKKVPKEQPPVVPGAPVPPPAPKKRKSPIVLVIAVVAVLLALGAAAFFVFRPKPTPVVEPPVNTAPPAPVCGDLKCDVSESYASCPADCPAPPPVCGDLTCDALETYAVCPADCPAPPPVCGDNRCEEPAEDSVSCPADCTPPMPTAGADLDSDGLSDEEESGIYGTNPNDPNTDKDSFVDLNELLNLFDPARPEPAVLKDSPAVTAFSSTEQKYSLLRPTTWPAQEDAVNRSTVFAAPSGETITLAFKDKAADIALMDWYLSQGTNGQVVAYKTRQGYSALISANQLVHYVDLGDRVLVATYSLGSRAEMQYKVTFQMMVQSLLKQP